MKSYNWIFALIINIIQLTFINDAQVPRYTKLYYSSMHWGTGWEVVGFPFSSNNVNYCAVDDCVYLTNSVSIIQRGIGTFGFNSIRLQYSVTPYKLSVNDKCRVSYSIDGINYQILQVYDQTSPQLVRLTSLGRDADNLPTVI